MLWDGRAITALLDFEWARGGPPDLDLDVLLRFCAFPYLHVAEDYEAITLAEGLRRRCPTGWPRTTPSCSPTRTCSTGCALYCIAYDVRELLDVPAAARRPSSCRRTTRTTGSSARSAGISHLDRLADGIDPELPWDFRPVAGPPLARH